MNIHSHTLVLMIIVESAGWANLDQDFNFKLIKSLC